jgi:hypothetical protein
LILEGGRENKNVEGWCGWWGEEGGMKKYTDYCRINNWGKDYPNIFSV